MLNFVIALKAEANPLINAFKLQHQPNNHFPLYTSENKTLIVSGMGRNRAAAATAWLAASYPAGAWLNVGIAGHANHDVGTLLAAHKITEYKTDKSWYPVHIKSPVTTESLTTFDAVQRHYLPNSLHDMEASAFYETALRFSSAELTHSVKIVSDNIDTPVDTLDKTRVENLVKHQIGEITDFCKHLCNLANDADTKVSAQVVDLYLAHWKFTVTQKHQLQRLLQRRVALGLAPDLALEESPDALTHTDSVTSRPTLPNDVVQLSDSKTVLRWLQRDTDTKGRFY